MLNKIDGFQMEKCLDSISVSPTRMYEYYFRGNMDGLVINFLFDSDSYYYEMDIVNDSSLAYVMTYRIHDPHTLPLVIKWEEQQGGIWRFSSGFLCGKETVWMECYIPFNDSVDILMKTSQTLLMFLLSSPYTHMFDNRNGGALPPNIAQNGFGGLLMNEKSLIINNILCHMYSKHWVDSVDSEVQPYFREMFYYIIDECIPMQSITTRNYAIIGINALMLVGE